jgi:hypothetical protein
VLLWLYTVASLPFTVSANISSGRIVNCLQLCMIWDVAGGDYEEFGHLGFHIPQDGILYTIILWALSNNSGWWQWYNTDENIHMWHKRTISWWILHVKRLSIFDSTLGIVREHCVYLRIPPSLPKTEIRLSSLYIILFVKLQNFTILTKKDRYCFQDFMTPANCKGRIKGQKGNVFDFSCKHRTVYYTSYNLLHPRLPVTINHLTQHTATIRDSQSWPQSQHVTELPTSYTAGQYAFCNAYCR